MPNTKPHIKNKIETLLSQYKNNSIQQPNKINTQKILYDDNIAKKNNNIYNNNHIKHKL